jgi:hypothetical protein
LKLKPPSASSAATRPSACSSDLALALHPRIDRIMGMIMGMEYGPVAAIREYQTSERRRRAASVTVQSSLQKEAARQADETPRAAPTEPTVNA